MTYKIFETCLLFPWGLTRSECASWVQAWGSILALGLGIGVAIYQARAQQRSTLRGLAEERRHEKLRVAETLGELAKRSLKLQQYLSGKLKDRQAVHDAAEDHLPFDLPELKALLVSLEAIELHALPASLVAPSLYLRSTVRQFKAKVEMALQFHGSMDAAAFTDFFDTMKRQNEFLETTVQDFEKELQRLRAVPEPE
jgi:hypothetical protein